MAQYQYFETSKLEKLFSGINEISDEQVDPMAQYQLSLAACEAAYKALFPLSFIQVPLSWLLSHLVGMAKSKLTRNAIASS